MERTTLPLYDKQSDGRRGKIIGHVDIDDGRLRTPSGFCSIPSVWPKKGLTWVPRPNLSHAARRVAADELGVAVSDDVLAFEKKYQ